MTTVDGMREIAECTADALAAAGLVFIEDERLDELAETLRVFLSAAGLPLDEPRR
ncbi:hypothetical protein Ait01nite_097840 [Actinoplanes italicus]|uniref:Uncharacterized protein n=1 Tax=Actinoplanes italicus TaxID=113567 RepID=A0A2T0K3E8_9ACTN|nr:hypothetical protein [Actinoplanes italicus]PRX17368.1 hypothetical protein CLV67_116144 [Actinoplanes italicus]GIE36739.1 hypothetical protein Ait01nite_097840 [Actinoplanes italicus]